MDTDLRHFLINTLDERWMSFSMFFKCLKANASVEAVHDIRVHIRRLLVFLDLLEVFVPQVEYKKVRATVKSLRHDLESLRDIQMIMGILSDYDETKNEIARYKKFLVKTERQLTKKTKKEIKTLDYERLNKCILIIRQTIHNRVFESEPANQLMIHLIDQEYFQVRAKLELLDQSKIDTIHDLRIQFRKFRYLVQILTPVMDFYPRDNFIPMREFQKMMGDIQNLDILIQQVSLYAKEHSTISFTEVIQEFNQKLEQSIRLFFEYQPTQIRFWRDSESAQFPWVSLVLEQ